MDISIATLSDPWPRTGAPVVDSTGPLHKTAQDFEAAVLAELLRFAGAGQPRSDFGGGVGEDQFASVLLDAQAARMAASGGIGLAEIVLRGLLAQDRTGNEGA